MEDFPSIKKATNEDTLPGLESESGHAEAVAFFERHRDFLDHYARGRVKILPAPRGLNTFAFNLETDEIYVNSMFYKKQGFSDEKTLFAICHEIEHYLEKKALLEEEGGERKFERYLKRIGNSRAFSLLDNCNADIRENRSVVTRTNQGMRDLEIKTYREDLFVETDFTSAPRHIQFSQALLRESRVPDERCLVAEDVRRALDDVHQVRDLMDIMTNPATPMSLRLRLQERYLWPKVEALLEKDLEDKKKQEEEGRQDSGGESGEGQTSEAGGNEEKGKEGEGDGKGDKSKSGEGEIDPNKIFADAYDKAEKMFPEAVPLKEVEKAFKAWQEKQREKEGVEQSDENYAKQLGVEKADLQNYRRQVDILDKIINPETGVAVIEELRELFSRIIAKRTKKALAPQYPVAEGDELVDPAGLIAEVAGGNLEPKVWQDTEIKERKGDRFGEVEITLVCDRSSSMSGQKSEEQKKSAVLLMEALKDFSELCQAEEINIDKPLEIRSEVYSFAGESEDSAPLKKMSPELGEAERIKVLKKLHQTPGSTTDFVCLEAIANGLDDKIKTKIEIGELKKIVIVFTDGESDNPSRVQAVLKSLRDSGVVAVGVGLTNDGQAVLSTYAPEAFVVEDLSRLAIVLGELLKEHLKNL